MKSKFQTVVESIVLAMKLAAVAVAIAVAVVLAQSPMFWGFIIITASAVLAVKVVGLSAFFVGLIASLVAFFHKRNVEEGITRAVEIVEEAQRKARKASETRGTATEEPPANATT